MRAQRLRGIRVLLSAVLAIGLLGGATSGPAFAGGKASCEVTGAHHARYATLQTAVDGSSVGASLRVRGTCVGLTAIDKSLRIRGISGHGRGRATIGDLTFGTAGPDVDATVRIRDLTIDGSISITGHREHVPPLPTDPHVTVVLRDVKVGHIGVSEGGVVILNGHTSVSGSGTGIRGFLDVRIVLNDHSSVDHNTGCGIDGTQILPVVLNDHSSIDHNGVAPVANPFAGCGLNLEAYSVVLNDHSSIHHNAGSGVATYDEGGGVRCNDHSSIHDNLHGIYDPLDNLGHIAMNTGVPANCVAGVNVYDNLLEDIVSTFP